MSTVIATLPVGKFPNAIALRPRDLVIDVLIGQGSGRHLFRYPYAYVANNDGDSVSVIRTSNNTVIKTLTGIEAPQTVKVSANGARAYVLRWQGVSVIDTATNAVVASIPHGSGSSFSLAISPDQKTLYIVAAGDTLQVVDIATTAVTTITVGDAPVDVDVSPDGAFVYTANAGDDTVTVVDVAARTVVATIPVGEAPETVVVSPDGTKVYVANAAFRKQSGTVSVIDTATNTVTATISVGANPKGIAVSPNGTRVFVTNYGDGVIEVDGKIVGYTGGTVSVINASNNTVIETVKVGVLPTGVAVSPQGDYIYVSNGDGTVSVIKIESELTKVLNKRILELIGAVDRGGGGWIILGNKVIPIPPRGPSVAIAARTAAMHLDDAFDSPVIAEQLRRLQG